MIFSKPDKLFLFGGADALVNVVENVLTRTDLPCCVYSCKRQLEEQLARGGTLESALKDLKVEFHSTEDINSCPGFKERLTKYSLGIGFGEAWSFDREVISAFGGNLLDLMGIRLPQYRGGAHYSWQILSGNRMGACNLQIINEEMVQGRYDSGEIVKFREYLFPVTARIPQDYFEHAVSQETSFILEFITEVISGHSFAPFTLQDNFSLFMPRLNTMRQGFVDWSWSAEQIDRFICGFDEPYAGAGTKINGEPVRLKSSRVETNDGLFHPFQAGLIYKKYGGAVYVATRTGTVIIERVLNASSENILESLEVGQRFFTEQAVLDQAMEYSAEYTTQGLRE